MVRCIMIVSVLLMAVHGVVAADTTMELLAVSQIPTGVSGVFVAPDGRRAAYAVRSMDSLFLVRLSMPDLRPIDTVYVTHRLSGSDFGGAEVNFGREHIYVIVGSGRIWRVPDTSRAVSSFVTTIANDTYCSDPRVSLQQIGWSDTLLAHAYAECYVQRWHWTQYANFTFVDTMVDTLLAQESGVPSASGVPNPSYDRRTFTVSSSLYPAEGSREQTMWVATATYDDSLTVRRFETKVPNELVGSTDALPTGEPGWVLWEAALTSRELQMHLVDIAANSITVTPRHGYVGNIGPMGLMLAARWMENDAFELQIVDLTAETVVPFDTIPMLYIPSQGRSPRMVCVGDTIIVHTAKELRMYRRSMDDRRGTVAIHRTKDSVPPGEMVLHRVQFYDHARARQFRWFVNDVESEITQQPFFQLLRHKAGAYVVRVEVLDATNQVLQRGATTTPCFVVDHDGIILSMRASQQSLESIDVSASGRYMVTATTDMISVWELDDTEVPLTARRVMAVDANGTASFKPGTDTLQWFRCDHYGSARSGGTFSLHSGYAVPPMFDTVSVASVVLPDSVLWLPMHDGRRVLLRSMFDPYSQQWALGVEASYLGQDGLAPLPGIMVAVEPAPRTGIRRVEPLAESGWPLPRFFRFTVGPRPFIGNAYANNAISFYDLGEAAYRTKLALPWVGQSRTIFHDASTIVASAGVYTVTDTVVTLWGAFEQKAWDVFSIPSTEHAVYYLYDSSVVARVFNVRTLQIDQWLRGAEMRPSCSAYDRHRHALFIGSKGGMVAAYGLRIPVSTSMQDQSDASSNTQMMTLIPNPASHTVYVKGRELGGCVQVQAVDLVGHCTTLACNGSTIDVGGLSPGIYALRIVTHGRIESLSLRILR